MRKRELGQAFILVLILLAIGALLVVPTLRLTSTSLKSSQIATRQAGLLYAADAAQEYVLWKLLHDGYGGEFTENGQVGYLSLDCCGISVNMSIVMRAVPGVGGIILSTDDTIRPTKTVSPDTIPNDTYAPVTYTINLEQLSSNTTQGLDVIYDILPKLFDDSELITGSCDVSIDGGSWQSVPDPAIEAGPSQWRLRWPASGNFSSDPGSPNYFHGMRDFNVRQEKELRFQLAHDFKGDDNDRVHCNWVILHVGNVVTASGPQAPITVGSPANPGVCNEDGMISADKVSNPDIIPPGVETDIMYTVNMTNNDGFTHHIEELTDYLPPGFSYTGPTSGITTDEPTLSLENVNGIDRWKLYWEFSPAESILAGEILSLVFWATTTKEISGSYYNEVILMTDVPIPGIFAEIGVTPVDYFECYSWNTGSVTVPTFDSESDADGLVIDANMSMILGSVAITSFHIH